MRYPDLLLTATVTGVVLVDQVSKAVVRAQIAPLGSVPLVPGILYVTHQRNAGAAFGVMQGGRFIFIGVGLVVIGCVVWYWNRYRPASWPIVLSLGLLAGGALGNLIDRILVGEVTDFLEFAPVRFPVFNVADMAVVVGTALLVLLMFFGGDRASDAQPDAADAESIEGASDA